MKNRVISNSLPNQPARVSDGTVQTGWLAAGILTSVLVLVVVFYDSPEDTIAHTSSN